MLVAPSLTLTNFTCNVSCNVSLLAIIFRPAGRSFLSWRKFVIKPAPSFSCPFVFWCHDLSAGPDTERKFTPTLARNYFRSVNFSGHLAGWTRWTITVSSWSGFHYETGYVLVKINKIFIFVILTNNGEYFSTKTKFGDEHNYWPSCAPVQTGKFSPFSPLMGCSYIIQIVEQKWGDKMYICGHLGLRL